MKKRETKLNPKGPPRLKMGQLLFFIRDLQIQTLLPPVPGEQSLRRETSRVQQNGLAYTCDKY